MPVLKRRTRVVTFRVSEEEFNSLSDACMASGARSISDFARSAVSQCLRREGASRLVREEIRVVKIRLDALEQELRRISDLIGAAGLALHAE